MIRLAQRAWILLVIALVVSIAAFSVDRVRSFFGRSESTRAGAGLVDQPETFNPKVVKYEIFGPGSVATINYLDLDALPQKALNAELPWSLTLTTTAPAASANIVAQSDGNSITCRITVDGVIKDEKTSYGVTAQTFCLVKSA